MIDFIEKILRMPRMVMTIMVVLIGGGFISYQSLPKESFPSIDIPYFYVSVSQSGVSPRDAQRLIAKPIEDRLNTLDDLENIRSTSSSGHVSVFLEFNVNADKDQALQDIRAKLDGVQQELPSDADEPKIIELSFTDQPVLQVAVYGQVPERTLIRLANDLKDAIDEIGDVQKVEVSGDREEVLEVQIDQLRLESYGLTAGQILDAVQKNHMMIAGGTLDSGQGSFNVEVPGLISTSDEVWSLPLKTVDGTVVTFGDVATVVRTFKDATEYAYVNGQPAITVGATKRLGTNIIEVADQIRAVTEEVTKDWPAEVQHAFLLDQSVSTKQLFRTLEASVLTAVVLVLVMCIATLGVRPAIMIGLSIPISFMMAFLVLQMIGMSVNMMTMFGLVIAVGVLVDDPIVVVEYAERKLSEGVSKKEAFIMAARKMFVPVVSATFTTLGAFIPLLFWPGIIGKFMSYLPTVVIIVMIASLVSALIFMPVIGSFIAKHELSDKEREAADVVMYPDKFDVNKVRGITGAYVRMMSGLLRRPLITLAVGFSIIGYIFFYYAQNPTGAEAFPASEPEYGTVQIITRGNYSPAEQRDFLLEVQNEVLQVEGVQDVIMGFGGGQNSPPDTIGRLDLQLQDWNARRPADEIFTEIRERTAHISGLEIQISAQENGPPAGKDINLQIQSNNYEDLAGVVAQVRDYVETQIPGTIDVEDGRPSPGIDWRLTFDRNEASKYGIGLRDLAPYVRLVTGGVTIGSYLPSDSPDEIDIVIRLPANERTLSSLDNLRIATVHGLVPLSNFVKRTPEPKIGNISRENGMFTMAVAANIAPGGIAGAEAVQQLKDWEQTQAWPDGVVFKFGGADEQMAETNAFIGKAFGAALALIFLILLIEYNSFYQVFVTLSTVLMSLAGVLLGMIVTGMSFSAIMTGLGIVALTGIVVKNGIVLIDTYNHYNRDDGVEPVKAMLLTVSQRVRPVLLTAIVTALGVVPMALNIEFDFIRREIVTGGLSGSWFVHLSAALVSGLLFSTTLTLIMVPVMVTAPSVTYGKIRRLLGRDKVAPDAAIGASMALAETANLSAAPADVPAPEAPLAADAATQPEVAKTAPTKPKARKKKSDPDDPTAIRTAAE